MSARWQNVLVGHCLSRSWTSRRPLLSPVWGPDRSSNGGDAGKMRSSERKSGGQGFSGLCFMVALYVAASQADGSHPPFPAPTRPTGVSGAGLEATVREDARCALCFDPAKNKHWKWKRKLQRAWTG